METGMIIGESNDSYHGNVSVSTSTIKDFIKSPYLYYRKHVKRDVERKETAAMTFGSSFHEFILEPDVFAQNHACLPSDFNGRTKEGKATKEAMEEGWKTILTQSDADALCQLRDSVYGNKTAAMILQNGKAEVSWRINVGAFFMQSRTDYFVESCTEEQAAMLREQGIDIKAGQPYIVDLKTTQELDAWFRDNYGNAIYQFGYQLQLAFYLAVINKIRKAEGKEIVRHFFFVVVEKQCPNDCAVIVLDERTFGLAQTQLKHHLAKLTECYKSGIWTGYKDRGICVAGVPEQIASREEESIFSEQTHKHSWLAGE